MASNPSADELQHLLHELQVHQIELEMQNQQLREAQQELEQSRDRYADLYDFAPLGYLTLDKDGVIREINLACAAMLGVERSHLLGKPFVFYVTRSEAQKFRDYLRRCAQAEEKVTTELRLVVKSGQSFQVQLSSLAVQDKERQILVYRTAITDMTERKQAEEEILRLNAVLEQRVLERTAQLETSNQQLETSNQQLEKEIAEHKLTMEILRLQSSIVSNMVEGVCLVRASDGVIVYANPKFERMFGYEASELKGKPVAILNYEDEEHSATEVALAIMDELKQIGAASYEIHNVKKDGTPFWCWAHASTFDHPKYGTVWLAIHEDITTHKEVEEERAQLAAIVKSSGDAIISWTLDQVIMSWNDAAERMYGYAAAEVLGKSYTRIVPPERYDEMLEFVEKIKAGERVSNLETKRLRKDGQSLDVSLTFSPIKDASGRMTGISTIARDITARVRAERELRHSREQLRGMYDFLQAEIEREKTRMAREIHDDLGQALTALKMDLTWLTQKMPGKLDTLREKGRAMLTYIDLTIKTVQRISAELRPGLLDDLGLSAAIEWSANKFHERTGIACEATFSPEDIVIDDECSTVAFRIFEETLTNIARHAQATKVEIGLQQQAHKLTMKVRDNGIGITPEQISDPKAFGLVGMRERVYPLGGKIKIKGVPNQGTIVFLRLPLKQILP